jgi:hypothetical protein
MEILVPSKSSCLSDDDKFSGNKTSCFSSEIWQWKILIKIQKYFQLSTRKENAEAKENVLKEH